MPGGREQSQGKKNGVVDQFGKNVFASLPCFLLTSACKFGKKKYRAEQRTVSSGKGENPGIYFCIWPRYAEGEKGKEGKESGERKLSSQD